MNSTQQSDGLVFPKKCANVVIYLCLQHAEVRAGETEQLLFLPRKHPRPTLKILLFQLMGCLVPALCQTFVSFSFLCKDYEYPLHSHSAHYQKNDRCPPPPQTLPDRACEVPSCRSDSECERHKRCCYNGCIYACLESVQPPPGTASQI